jgi:hypothetical protein
MTILAETVRFDDDAMWVYPYRRPRLRHPLAWFPRLLHANSAERAAVTLTPIGLHWEALDQDISIAGLLSGGRIIARETISALGRCVIAKCYVGDIPRRPSSTR